MRRLGTNPRRGPVGLRRARRGYSLLELAVALGIFLLLASVVSLAVAQAVSTQSSLRTQRAVSNALEATLEDLSRTSYDQLLSNSFTPPDLCEGAPQNAGDSTQSCIRLGNQGYRVNYRVSVGEDVVDLNAYVELTNGVRVEQTRRVVAPSAGYAPGHGVVRLTLTGDWKSLKGPVYLLRQDGSTAATGKPSEGGVVLLRAPANVCTPAAPCSTALASGGATAPGNLGMTTPEATGSGIVLTDGSLIEAAGRVFLTGKAQLALVAQSDTPTVSGAATPAGSVCLWGRFLDGAKEHTVPLCNTGKDAGVITVATYAPDARYPNVTRPIPTDVPIRLSVDRPDNTCPYAPGMVGATANGWVQAAVCTSWTWGVPASFGAEGGALSSFQEPTVTLRSSEDDRYRVVWSGDLARPAAGYGAEPVWAKPRQAAGCAFDGTCVSLGNEVPEATECPGKHCLSAANFLPELTAPATGAEKIPTVAVTGASTPFDLSALDRDGSAVQITLARAPDVGTLHLASGSGDLAAGTILSSGTSPATVQLVYQAPTGMTLATFVVTIADDRGSRDVEVGLYNGIRTWKVVPNPVSAKQGAAATLSAKAVGTDGEPLAGVQITFETPTGVTPTPAAATTGANGVAQVQVQVGDIAATTYQVKVTAADSGRSASLPLTITQAAGSLTVDAVGAAQGQRGYVVARTVDRSGAPLPGVTVNLAALKDGVASTVVYPEYTGCVTQDNGECQVSLIVEANAPNGQYQVTASSGDFSDVATVTVTQAVHSVTGPSTNVVQGSSADITLTARDGAGNPMPGAALSLSGSKPYLQASPSSVTTDGAGQAVTRLSVTADAPAGTVDLVATASGYTGRIQVQVSQKAGSIQPGPNVEVRQGAETSVWVTILDGAGNPMPGVSAGFTAPAGSGLTVSSKATSGSDGRATAGVTAQPGKVGTHAITITAGGLTTTVQVTVKPVLGSVSTQGGATQTGTSDVGFVLTDLNGDPISGQTPTITSATASITVEVTGPSSSTGTVPARVTTSSTPAGTYQLQVTLDGRSVPALLVVS